MSKLDRNSKQPPSTLDDPTGVWELQVLGKNGVTVQGTLHTPSSPPVVLRSQDLIQIADRSFYFLLPRQQQWCVHPILQLLIDAHWCSVWDERLQDLCSLACQPTANHLTIKTGSATCTIISNVLHNVPDIPYARGVSQLALVSDRKESGK